MLALFNIFVAIILAGVGYHLTTTISHLPQTVTGVDTLLINTNVMLRTSQKEIEKFNRADSLLASEILLLDSQLRLNEEAQRNANIFNDYSFFSNEEKLYGAFEKVEHTTLLYYCTPIMTKSIWGADSVLNRSEFCGAIKNLLDPEYSNPVLIDNRNLLEKFRATTNALNAYLLDCEKFSMHKEIPFNSTVKEMDGNDMIFEFRDGAWINTFVVKQNMELMNNDWSKAHQCLDNLMAYAGKNHPHHFPRYRLPISATTK